MTVEPHKANETPEVPGKPHRGRHLLLAVVLSLVVGVVGVVCFDKFVLPGDGVANTSKLYDYVYTSGKSENLAFVLNNMNATTTALLAYDARKRIVDGVLDAREAQACRVKPVAATHEGTGAPNEVWSYGEEACGIMTKYIFLREKMRDYTRNIMVQ